VILPAHLAEVPAVVPDQPALGLTMELLAL
jgi:hypothetical protein